MWQWFLVLFKSTDCVYPVCEHRDMDTHQHTVKITMTYQVKHSERVRINAVEARIREATEKLVQAFEMRLHDF